MRLNNISRRLTFLWTRDLKPRFGLDVNYKGRARSPEPIEVVIPCLDKDIATLPYVVESLRQYLKHPLREIYIISPKNSKKIADFCRKNNCKFIDEATVSPVSKDQINYRAGGLDRSGWLLQQLIKLSADKVTKTKNFMVWDADTVLLKPQAYLRGGKYVLNHSDEFHSPYFENYQKLMNEPTKSKVSFISHHMIISGQLLKDLKDRLESESGNTWYQAIIDSIDHSEPSSFSEYELYGNFLNSYYPHEFVLDYWFNYNTPPRSSLTDFEKIRSQKANHFKSVSWHSYN